MAKAYFAAGCFWGVEDTFRGVQGVTATRVGYSGGRKEHPSYEEVCTGRTGHAETVEVEYDPQRVGYDDLLEVFWNCHDPTEVNRQGPDVGTQYRTAVFYVDEAQKQGAEASKARQERAGRFDRPVATEITAFSEFWPAEDYHQQYVEKRRRKVFGLF